MGVIIGSYFLLTVTVPVSRFAHVFLPSAWAEGCPGGGGGEEKEGGKAGEILLGVAAIIAAVSPMVAAGIQASADKQIAKTNADAQIKMTTIASDTSKELAGKQQEIALTQTAVAQDISKQNNDSQTRRLDMQLAELRNARQENQQVEREKRAQQKEYDDQRIQLAKEQADNNLKLAKEAVSAQLTQAGLTQGFASSRNSGNRLNVERTITQRTGSTSGETTASKLGSSLASNTPKTPPTTSKGQPTGGTGGVQTAVKAIAPSTRLVASLQGKKRDAADVEEEEDEIILANGKRVKRAALRGVRIRKQARGAYNLRARSATPTFANVAMVGRALNEAMQNNPTVRGSTLGERTRVQSTTANSDLGSFLRKTASIQENESFASYETRHRSVTTINPYEGSTTEAASHSGHYHSEAYNPPAVNSGESIFPGNERFSLRGIRRGTPGVNR